MIEYLCKKCGRSYQKYNSLQTKCGLCAYNMNAKPKKPMKRIGPVTKKWIEARNEWLQRNPPNADRKWSCALRISPRCLRTMDIDQLTVDHIKSRSRHPELRFEQSNLQAACSPCNEQKGSGDAV